MSFPTAAKRSTDGCGSAWALELNDGPAHRIGVCLEGIVLTARQWRTLTLQRRAAWTLIGLAAAVHLPRDRRVYAQVIVKIIELTAISQIARKELAATFWGIMQSENKRLAEYAEELHQREVRESPAA